MSCYELVFGHIGNYLVSIIDGVAQLRPDLYFQRLLC